MDIDAAKLAAKTSERARGRPEVESELGPACKTWKTASGRGIRQRADEGPSC